MKITNIDTFIVDAGWRPWTFVIIETDEGITGYGVTDPPEIIDGYMTTPTKLGWGTDLNEAEVKKHLWENRSANW